MKRNRSLFILVLCVAMLASLSVFAGESRNDVVRVREMPEYIAAHSYIFVFDDQAMTEKLPVAEQARALSNEYGGQLRHAYSYALKGFSAMMTAEAAQSLFENHPEIKYYEQNGVVWAVGKPPWAGGGGDTSGQVTPWGVTRVGGGISGTFCKAWIIDTGVDLDNPDLNVDTADSIAFARSKNGADDDNGHGTHVAGTIAAIDNDIDVVGVAAGAPVVGVKVLDRRGSGSWDDVLAGIDYVAQHAGSCDVANMSLGGGYSQALNDAVISASHSCTFVIAAGNDGIDASNASPASANGGNILTISAIDENDHLASWSNYGVPPVDFAEPGVNILSLKKGGGTTTMSGTSMATPHAAGLVLLGNIRTDGYTNADPNGDVHPIGVH